MEAGYRAHAVVSVSATNDIKVVEVLPELSVATRCAFDLSQKNRDVHYIVCETMVRYGRSKPILQKDARRMILEEWNKRPKNKRTEQHMFGFFSTIHTSTPELTGFRTSGEPWMNIQCWLLEEEGKNVGSIEKGSAKES